MPRVADIANGNPKKDANVIGLGAFRLPLKEYSAGRIEENIRWKLLLLCESCNHDPMLRMILRNMDRECDRKDINETTWVEFLRELAASVLPRDLVASRAYEVWLRCRAGSSAEDDWYTAERELAQELVIDPIRVIDSAIASKKSLFILSGLALPDDKTHLCRYITIADFLRFNLRDAPLRPEVFTTGPDETGFGKMARWINAGAIDRRRIAGSAIGRPGYPVWCTDESLKQERSAGEIRNALGLKHVESGFLVELHYPAETLRRRQERLRAPTFLDACAGGAGNWIFVKNRHRNSGPDWGYTGRLTGDGVLREGVPEAVHTSFTLDETDVGAIDLRAAGPIQNSPPDVNYARSFEEDV